MKKERKDEMRDASAAVQAPSAVKAVAEVYDEPAIPLLLCLVCMAITLVAALINAFIYPFGNNLLAPAVLQIIAMILPCYLMLLATHPRKTAIGQFKEVGFGAISAKYIFFMLFSALFMMSASMVVSILFGGVYSSAEGLALLGTFTAGSGDYTASIPYLILVYALIPAVAEELLLRGMIFSQLKGLGFVGAAAISAVMSGFMSFSLGGFIPAAFAALVSCFVLYTTGSLWACVIVRMLFGVYRLLLEVNISAYYVSSSSRGLILVVIFVAFLIFGVLFFGESARIYREKSDRVKRGEAQPSSLGFESFVHDVKATVSYRPTVILTACCAVIYCAVLVIGYFT